MKKLKIKLTPEKTIELSPKMLNLRKDTEGKVIDIVFLIEKLLWIVFFLFLFSSHVFKANNIGLGNIYWLYIFTLIFIALQVSKKIVLKGDYLATVMYDVLILGMTTMIAISLFFTTTETTVSFNIWGGENLRLFSGISIISFWFIYYMAFLNHATKRALSNVINLVVLSPLVAFFINFIFSYPLDQGFSLTMALMLPFWMVLLISKERFRWIYFLNLIIAFIILNNLKDIYIMSVLGSTFIALAILVLFKNSWSIKKLYLKFDKDVEEFAAKKLPISKLVNKNSELLLFVSSILLGAINIVWVMLRGEGFIFQNIINGFDKFSNLEFMNMLLGDGIVNFNTSYFMQFLLSYGALASVFFLLLIVFIYKDILFSLRIKIKNGNYLVLLSFTLITPLILQMLIGGFNELLIIFFWIALLISSLIKFVYIDKKDIDLSIELKPLILLTKKQYEQWGKKLQLVVVLILFIIIVYLINLVLGIEQFLIS